MLRQEEPLPGPPQPPTSERHIRRWRAAVTAISVTRFLLGLTNYKVVEKNAEVLRSFSFATIDIDGGGDKHVSILDVDPRCLAKMVKEKSLQSLNDEYGGVKQVAALLQSDSKNGIPGDDVDHALRTKVFGSNKHQKQPAKSFLSFVLESFKDTIIIILLICAVLSLAFGIKQHGLQEGWYDGGSIIIAVFLVVVVSSVSNYRQSRQFEKLSHESSDIPVQVVRSGRHQPVSIFDIVVGDVVSLKTGDQIPADGLLVDGHSLRVSESSMTGESDHVEVNAKTNPFLLSGTKVTDGHGFMIVTSVGMNTAWGEMMSSIRRDSNEETPLQARLSKLTSYIGKIGLSVAVLVLLVLLIRYFTGHTKDDNGKTEFYGSKTKFDDVINSVIAIIAAAVTIVVVAIPEGLPLAVTLTLAYSMNRMMKDRAMVRKLSACETMGSATVICTDKTGTLTLNEMKVAEFWVGKEKISSSSSSEMAANVLELLTEGVGLNTTGTVYKHDSTSVPEIYGSPTEKAILSWAVIELGLNIDEPKQSCEVIHVEAFNSEKKRSGVLKRRSTERSMVGTHWKGAAEMILDMCSFFYDKNGISNAMDDDERARIGTIIERMANKSLRCIAFAHGNLTVGNEHIHTSKLEETGLTWLGLVGLKDPCRPGVKEAVKSCKKAGVSIKMISGDNIHTARAIAFECGILDSDNILNNEVVVEGVQFRNYSPEERLQKIEIIRVMARSSPFDKLLMVQSLKQKGHVVAVTGDGTNDAPALKEADIGLSMGIQGTEVAKGSSDIVILDDNFTSVATVLRWGRCVYNNIQKFIQFQLTVNVAALVINFIAGVAFGKVPLTAVQLLWVNLIMDTLGALALAAEQPTEDLMVKPPVGRTEPLITKVMWRNLVAQALYQVSILLILQFKGKSIFGVSEKVNNTLIFNTFVLCQIFNEFNSRNLEKKNIFKAIHKNKLLLVIIGVTLVLQAVMVEFLQRFANTERLDWQQWGACIAIAALSWPIGWIVKFIPVDKQLRKHDLRLHEI